MKNLKQLIRQTVTVIFMLMAFSTTLCAQNNITVTGTVSDASDEPLIGASVVVKGQTSLGTVTDFDGNFTLKVPSESTVLVVSYVGMTTKEIRVGKQRDFKITLADDTQLEEVVVVGYGQQKKASVVGSITQTTGAVLERAGGVSNIGAALTGNLPGVVTMASTGMPGEEDPKIVIRGISSWNSSDPLVLVDGIERPLGSIDISSVESISVLKDASATAVYGVKGANGVILVTTKRGQEGKAKIEIGMQATLKAVSQLPGKYDSPSSLRIRNQAIEQELGLKPGSWGDIVSESVIDKYANPTSLEDAERYPNVDWQDLLFKKTAMSYNPHVNISGGTKFVKYFASVDFVHEGDLYRQYNNNRGYEPGYGYNRINVRSNLDFQLTKTTKLKANLFGSNGVKKGPYGIQSAWHETQLWESVYSAPTDAFLPIYSDGTWGYYPKDSDGQTAHNSVQDLATHGVSKTTTTRINTDFTLEQDLSFITKGLRASFMISWDNVFVENNRGINDQYTSGAQRKWIDPETGEATYELHTDSQTGFDPKEILQWQHDGGSVDNRATVRNLYYQAQLFWGRQFGKHDITAMGVFNRTENTYGNNFTNYREDWAFRATYNYAGRYFLEYNGAYNGSEKFSKDNRFAFFNSGAIGWLVSEEKFWEPIKPYVTMLKFRYSIGEVGDDNVPKRWLYATQWAYGGNIVQGLNTDSSPYTWYKESTVGNPDIHWEKSLKRNFGIDYSFFNGLISGSLEFFNDRRSDILVLGANRSVPSYYGAEPAAGNIGRVKTSGYELELRVNKVLKNGMRFWGNFNTTHAKSLILEYDDAELLPAYQKQTGFAIGQDHSNLTTGFANNWDQVIGMTQFNTNDDQKLPGSYIIQDYNGDGVIDSNDSAPYGYTGTPENTYSASIGWEWKNFSIYCQFYGVTNVNRYVAFSNFPKQLDTVHDEGTFWTSNTMDADAPMPRWSTTPSYYEGTHYHYDGSYIRLKNAEIAYTFTQPWVKKIGLNSIKLYLNGNNLWVWSHMPDDREANFGGTGLASQGAYPTVKRYNLGIKINL